MVHHQECLRGDRAGGSIATLNVWVREIENLENFRQPIAKNWDVNASSRAVKFVTVLAGGPVLDVRSAILEIKCAGEPLQGVSNVLRTKTLAVHPPEQSILGIDSRTKHPIPS